MSTHYDTLHVARDARQHEVKSAYRLLIRDAHPDAGGGDAQAQVLNEAYAVLSDAAKRAEYDLTLISADRGDTAARQLFDPAEANEFPAVPIYSKTTPPTTWWKRPLFLSLLAASVVAAVAGSLLAGSTVPAGLLLAVALLSMPQTRWKLAGGLGLAAFSGAIYVEGGLTWAEAPAYIAPMALMAAAVLYGHRARRAHRTAVRRHMKDVFETTKAHFGLTQYTVWEATQNGARTQFTALSGAGDEVTSTTALHVSVGDRVLLEAGRVVCVLPHAIDSNLFVTR